MNKVSDAMDSQRDLGLTVGDLHLASDPDPERPSDPVRAQCWGCWGCREGCREGCRGCREGCRGCREGCRGCRR